MNSTDVKRRWLGVVCLGIAILMVVWGQLFLPLTAPPLLLIAFWLVCMIFTVVAILMAFADLRALRNRTRAERQALFLETMHEIDKEVDLAAWRR